MNNNSVDVQQIILDMIDYSKTNKHIEFYFLKTWSEYIFYRSRAKTLKIFIKVLEKSAKRLFKKYCFEVTEQISEVTKLLAYKQLIDTVSFYKEELAVIKDMLYEYEAYLMDGHILSAFFGDTRETKDLIDFRERDYYGP